MEDTANESELNGQPDYEANLRALKHDVNNQLSNIMLALEQLRYELPDATEDCIFYLDSITMSATRINNLIKAQQ